MDRSEANFSRAAVYKRAHRARLKARRIVPINLNIPEALVEFMDSVKTNNGLHSRDLAFQLIVANCTLPNLAKALPRSVSQAAESGPIELAQDDKA
jgi:hypothetical protein